VAYTIQLARVGIQQAPGAEIYWMQKFEEWEPLWFTTAIVRGEGRTIVINTGFEEEVNHLVAAWHRWHPRAEFTRSPEERMPAVLDHLGIDPATVDAVILTPLGAYSTGNISLFPNAQICLLRRGWVRLLAPERDLPRASPVGAFPRSELLHLLTDAWSRVRFLEDEDVVAPGIRTFYAGVHHPSTIAILIDTPSGVACYSDSFFTFRNLEENVPVGIGRDLDEAYRTYARVRGEARLFIPAYDPAVFDRYPGGRVG
jgi:hypothetical protein